jgi:enoyl-CoA hydratase
MEEPEVIARIEGVAGRITLNRPRALNALNADMCLAISDALLAWREDGQIGSVIIDGAGERAFCAGGDIRVVAESGKGDGAEARRFFHAEYRMNDLLQRYPKPVVAIMDGITMGGGVGISAPARYRVATEKTMWAMPEGDIGLFPDVGGGWHLSRLPGQAGVWLALTGARLRAADCRALGIATHFVPARELDALKAGLADGGAVEPFDEAPEPAPISANAEAIDRLFAGGSVEQIMDNLAADGSDWALEQHAILSRKCPATLKVALRLIREGARMTSFADEMTVEYRVAVRMIHRHDFIEGVRAVIVDKDNTPRWDPPSPAGVTDAVLDEIFAPLPPSEEWSPLP